MSTSDTKGWIGLKTEATPNTYETIAPGTDKLVRAYDVSIEPHDDWGLDDRDGGEKPDGIGSEKAIPGDRAWKISFKLRLVLPGTVGDLETSPIGIPLRASPLTVTETAATKVDLDPSLTYDTSSSPQPCSLLYVERGGWQYKARGVVLGWKIIGGVPGDFVVLQFDGYGNFVEMPSAGVSLASVVQPDADTPLRNVNATFDPDYDAANSPAGLSSWEFDPGIKVELNPDAAQTYGYGVPWAEMSGPATLSFQMDAQTPAEVDVWATALGSFSQSLSIEVGGLSISGDNAQHKIPKRASNSGQRKWDCVTSLKSPADQGGHFKITLT